MLEQKSLWGDSDLVIKPPITREQLADVLFGLLSTLTLDELVHIFTNEFKETFEYIHLQKGEDTCQNTSLLFNPHRFDTIAGDSKQSVFGALKNPSYASGLARAVLFDKQYNKNRDYMFHAFALGVNGVQYVNEFYPYLARDICEEFHLSAEHKVLDPCAGWGGRMLGISTVVNSYTAFEPSTRTVAGLDKLERFIRRVDPDFHAFVNCLPFEDSKLEDNAFDFAFTSPPYYDTEKYSDEPTQSFNRYKSFLEWVTGFYLPLIRKTMAALKPGKFFVLNIGNRKYKLGDILLQNFSTQFAIRAKGSYNIGSAGLGREGSAGEQFYAIQKPMN
jgi:hypothetical protein